MKLIRSCILVFLALFIISCSSTITNKAPSAYTQRLNSSTVALIYHDTDADAYKAYCTGVWVAKDEILTAHHCVVAIAKRTALDKTEEMPDDLTGTKMHFTMSNEVAQYGEEPTVLHLAKAVRLDEAHDLALVQVEGTAIPDHEIATLPSKSPAVGEKIYIVGHPGGMYWTYIEGTVASYRERLDIIDKTGPWLQVEAPVWYGNSGGGCFDSDGHLVGIASFISRAPEQGFFVHAETIRKFLYEHHKEVGEDLKRIFTLP